MTNFKSEILKSKRIHGGTLHIKTRNVSYWNDEHGPNREDQFLMTFVYQRHEYIIGSHPRPWITYLDRFSTEEVYTKLNMINAYQINTGKLPLIKYKGEVHSE